MHLPKIGTLVPSVLLIDLFADSCSPKLFLEARAMPWSSFSAVSSGSLPVLSTLTEWDEVWQRILRKLNLPAVESALKLLCQSTNRCECCPLPTTIISHRQGVTVTARTAAAFQQYLQEVPIGFGGNAMVHVLLEAMLSRPTTGGMEGQWIFPSE